MDDELTPDEITALADAFAVGASARTLLLAAKFPTSAIPVTGFGDSQEFWELIAAKVAQGVMPDGRRKILAAARRRFPYNRAFADPPAPPASADGPLALSVRNAQGVQVGGRNTQINYFLQESPSGGAAVPSAVAPLRILVLGASPAGLPPVRADKEARQIEDAVAADRAVVRYVAAAVATDLGKVRAFRPDIVHFVCHGADDQLAFNDSLGEYDLVKADGIADALAFYRERAGIRLRAIVLAACDGQKLAPFFTRVADTVIAHRGKLADPCGMAFAGQFYQLLSDAVGAAQAASRAAGDPAAPDLSTLDLGALDLGATASEAAVLTVAQSSSCAPVRSNLIVLPAGG